MIGLALIVIAIIFLVILWFSRKIWEKYHKTKKLMSAKTQAIQKQLSIVLIAQVKTIEKETSYWLSELPTDAEIFVSNILKNFRQYVLYVLR